VLGKHSNYHLDLRGRAHRLAFSVPLQHESITSGTATILRRSRTASFQTNRDLIAVRSVFLIQKPQLLFPKVDRTACVEKVFLGSQLKFPQSLGLGSAAKVVELLSVNAKDVAETIPARMAQKTSSKLARSR
jgi:hypothetical protein